MTTTPEFTVGSKEWLRTRVGADTPLQDSEPVSIKFNGTWRTASWVGDVGLTRIARTLVDFTDVAPGSHSVYTKVTDDPEVPIIYSGKVRVKAEMP